MAREQLQQRYKQAQRRLDSSSKAYYRLVAITDQLRSEMLADLEEFVAASRSLSRAAVEGGE